MTIFFNVGVSLATIIVAKDTPTKLTRTKTIIFSIGALNPLLPYKTTTATLK